MLLNEMLNIQSNQVVHEYHYIFPISLSSVIIISNQPAVTQVHLTWETSCSTPHADFSENVILLFKSVIYHIEK